MNQGFEDLRGAKAPTSPMAIGKTGFEDLRGYQGVKPAFDPAVIGKTGFEDLAEKKPGFWESAKRQMQTTVSNMADTMTGWAGNVSNAFDAYGKELKGSAEQAMRAYQQGEDLDADNFLTGHHTDGYQRAKMNLYNESVGKPAGYLAITPGVPAPVRAGAGILAAPMVFDGTVQSYGQAVESGSDSPIRDTAKHTLIDPVIDPIQRLYEDPKTFGQNLVDNPFNVWDNVFLPGAMIHGTAKGIKEVTPNKIKEPISRKIGSAKEYFAEFKEKANNTFRPIDDSMLDTQDFVATKSGSAALYEKIVEQESGGNFEAVNADSGAKGNIQWMPETWAAEAERVLGDRTAPMTPHNQDIVARAYIDRLYKEFGGNERAVAAAIYAGEEYGRQMHKGKYLFDPNTRINAEGDLSANGKYPSVNEYVEQVLGRKVQGKVVEQPKFEPVEPKEIEFAKEPIADLNATEHIDKTILSEKLRTGEIVPEPRALDEVFFQKVEKMSAKERYDYVKERTAALKEGVKDSQGNIVKFVFDENNTEQINGLIKHLAEGTQGVVNGPHVLRTFAMSLIDETIAHPDVKLKQANGNIAYISYWKGKNNVTHELIVSTNKGEVGKIITSYATKELDGKSKKAINRMASVIEKADSKLMEVSNFIKKQYEGDLSGYPRTPSSDRVSPSDTKLHPSGNLNIPEEKGPVKEYFSDNPKSPYRYQEGPENLTQERPVTRQELYKIIDEGDVALKHGRIGKKGVRGWHDGRANVVRIKDYGDFETVAHELGHYIDKRYNFSGAQDGIGANELLLNVDKRFGDAYSGLDTKGLLKEGFAEFFRDYTTNRARAKAEYPSFYERFENTISSDKALKSRVEKLSRPLHQWYRQSAHDRVKGSISFEREGKFSKFKNGNFIESVKDLSHDIYTHVVDELHPLSQLEKSIEAITGEKIAFEDSVFKQAWISRGWVGKAEALLEFGDQSHGIKSFKEILGKVPEKLHKDLSAYMVALREVDIHKWNKLNPNEAIKTTFSLKDAMETVKAYENNRIIKTAQKELISYQKHLLKSLTDEGLISSEAYQAMVDKYPNYVPFFREIGDIEHSFGGSTGSFINVKAPIKKMKGSTRDIIDPLESIIKNTFAITRSIERNKVGKKLVKLAERDGVGGLVEEVTGSAKALDNTFYVYDNGVKRVFETTPTLYKTLKMMNEHDANLFVKLLQPMASWLRAGATLTPEFSISNFTRDTISAMLFSKRGFIPVYDNMKGLMSYLKKDALYQEYMKSGAAHSALVAMDRNYLQGQVQSMLKSRNVLSMVARNPIEVLRALSEAVEASTRLGEFANAKEGYTGIGNRLFGREREVVSSAQAALETRDLTLDFSRIGRSTKGFNKITAFFNASIQGTDKLFRAFIENPKDMAVKAVLVGLASYTLWNLNKDDPRYQELPQWEKDIYWIVPGKDVLYKIPKPFEMGILFGSSVERMMQWAYDKEKGVNGVGFKGFGAKLADVVSPSVIPTGLLPIFEALSNHSFFMNRDIVPSNQSNLPPKLQYGPNTSATARGVGAMIGVSPYIVDNTIRGVGGGLATIGTELIDRALDYDDHRPAKKWNEEIGIRKFVVTPYKTSDSVQRVYDEFTEQEKLFNAYKLTGEKPEGFNAKEYGKLKNAYEALRNTNKTMKAIRASKKYSPEEKREKIDKLKMIQANIARKALGKAIIQ